MSHYLLLLALAVAAGAVTALLAGRLWKKAAERAAEDLRTRLDAGRARELETLLERVKGAFAILSQEALDRSTDGFLKLAGQTLGTKVKEGEKELEGKKQLIEQSLKAMTAELDRIRASFREFENERGRQYGTLTSQLRSAGEVTVRLEQTTGRLTAALGSSKQRGQWGERMAEDVLRLAGFKEGIQYSAQKGIEGGSARPDFTFFLPNDLAVNMDVKFPLDNYLRYASAEGDADRERYKAQFLRDVQNRIKEVTGREYIDPDARTVDYVLVFIPNEQVYAFIWEHAREIIDKGIEQKVIICSPVSLLAILGVIRRAVENFNLERTTADILSLLGAFSKQWEKFVEAMEKMGKKLEEAEDEFQRLVSTRRTGLERPLRKIDELRRNRGIEIAAPPEADDGAGGENALTGS